MNKIIVLIILLINLVIGRQIGSLGNSNRMRDMNNYYSDNQVERSKISPENTTNITQIWIFLLCYFIVVICIIVAVTIFVLKKNMERNTAAKEHILEE